MSKTLVCSNVLHSVNSLAYGSHCQEWFRMGRNTKDEFILFHPDRFSIDNARNQAARFALQFECDYIYFVDDDMVLSPNTYASLKKADGDVVQALTFIRGMPFEPMFFKNEGTQEKLSLKYYRDWEGFINEDGLVPCYAVGFACALLKVSTMKKIPPPYFITSTHTTEDVYFCVKLREYFDDIKIFVDTKVPTGHILHPEVITRENRNKLMKYYGVSEKAEKMDRGKEYLEKCKTEIKVQQALLKQEPEREFKLHPSPVFD